MPTGVLLLKKDIYAKDFRPIDENCKCSTCRQFTRAYLHTVVQTETVACSLLTVHNVAYQVILYLYEVSGKDCAYCTPVILV